ncbi:hypothetical protein LX36DRAFT_32905 [Colletotrichum falcatum]|nr:hypothetical protein LX36DRAFT_32905 [Colletotrichum falcatum]
MHDTTYLLRYEVGTGTGRGRHRQGATNRRWVPNQQNMRQVVASGSHMFATTTMSHNGSGGQRTRCNATLHFFGVACLPNTPTLPDDSLEETKGFGEARKASYFSMHPLAHPQAGQARHDSAASALAQYLGLPARPAGVFCTAATCIHSIAPHDHKHTRLLLLPPLSTDSPSPLMISLDYRPQPDSTGNVSRTDTNVSRSKGGPNSLAFVCTTVFNPRTMGIHTASSRPAPITPDGIHLFPSTLSVCCPPPRSWTSLAVTSLAKGLKRSISLRTIIPIYDLYQSC